MTRDAVIIDISAGEVVLTDWSDELCDKSAKAIADRVGHIDPSLLTPRGSVDKSDRRIQITRGRKARNPKGHRVAYYVKIKSFGKSDGDLAKLLKKAKDAGKV